MSVAYLDTHVAVFLHAGLLTELSFEAKRQIEASELLISPIVFLEFDYLYQRRKISFDARQIFTDLYASFGITLCDVPFAAVANEGLNIGWTTDPFDRLIVAQAKANSSAILITRDRLIRENYPHARW